MDGYVSMFRVDSMGEGLTGSASSEDVRGVTIVVELICCTMGINKTNIQYIYIEAHLARSGCRWRYHRPQRRIQGA